VAGPEAANNAATQGDREGEISCQMFFLLFPNEFL